MKWFDYDRPLTQAPSPWYPDRVFPVALSLGGLLIRVVALAVLPRVTSALARAPKAELEIAVAPRAEETPAVEEAALKIRKVASPRWPNSLQTTPKRPPLQAWRTPVGARAPPLAGAGTRSRAYLHRRSYPINRVDPSGLVPEPLPPFDPAAGNPADAANRQVLMQRQNGGTWSNALDQFFDFLNGEPMVTTFGPESQASKDMQADKDRIQRGIDDWTSKNQAARKKNPNCPAQSTVYYPDKNWGFNGGPWQAGLNSTRHFVGGYRMTLEPEGSNLKITIWNTTSAKSLFYDVSHRLDNPMGAAGPMHNQTQLYYWTVPRPRL